MENSIYRSLDIIEKRINEKLTVANIAADVYLSKFYYMRLFREIVGDSVMDYVNKRKLTLAAIALIETNESILDIALSYGYDSREGFSRSFKAFTGVAPADYRKHSKNMVSINPGKEYMKMTYTKTINAVTSEINEWILLAKDIIKQMHQYSDATNKTFWGSVIEQTEFLECSFTRVLERVTSIACKPDEISTGMDIVKTIDDTIFVAHSIAFQIELMEARMPDRITEEPLSEKYRNLAMFGIEKTKKITEFFRELLLLVIEDMRKTAIEKINEAAKRGKTVAESIPDNNLYIKDEIIQLVEMLTTTPDELITVQMIDDSFFKSKLIAITAKLNIDSANRDVFEKMQIFLDRLNDTVNFCRTIIKPIEDSTPLQKNIKIMQDIVYMENVLLFYANGEIEYLSRKQIGSGEHDQKADFIKIKNKIDKYKTLAFYAERDESNITIFHDLANNVNEIISELHRVSKITGSNGGAIKVIADELKRLTAKTFSLLNDIKDMEGE